jgi:hypothetical protein
MIRIMVDGLPVYVVDVLSAAILARHLKDAGPDDEPRNEKGEWTSGGGGGGGGDVVEHHKARLTAALAEPEDFEKAFADIQRLDTPTLKKLARSFSGTQATSRADALDRIKSRHTNLMAAGARVLAYGGRTAG